MLGGSDVDEQLQAVFDVATVDANAVGVHAVHALERSFAVGPCLSVLPAREILVPRDKVGQDWQEQAGYDRVDALVPLSLLPRSPHDGKLVGQDVAVDEHSKCSACDGRVKVETHAQKLVVGAAVLYFQVAVRKQSSQAVFSDHQVLVDDRGLRQQAKAEGLRVREQFDGVDLKGEPKARHWISNCNRPRPVATLHERRRRCGPVDEFYAQEVMSEHRRSRVEGPLEPPPVGGDAVELSRRRQGAVARKEALVRDRHGRPVEQPLHHIGHQTLARYFQSHLLLLAVGDDQHPRHCSANKFVLDDLGENNNS